MKKKCKKTYKIELTKEELDILYQAKNIIDEIDSYATEHNIEELQWLTGIDEYIEALDPHDNNNLDTSSWIVPEGLTAEETRMFYK